jgi:hypothetical protein
VGRDDFPFIVGVRVGVPGDLLTCSQSSDTVPKRETGTHLDC